MCIYPQILGTGDSLVIQLATLFAISMSVVIWLWLYYKTKINIKKYAIPIVLWIIFGTLDIVITAKGTFGNPYREGNPLTQTILVGFGFIGPVVASILWIGFWAGLVLVINKLAEGKDKRNQKLAMFFSLIIFYSLAVGHLFGFSSWYLMFCPIAKLFGFDIFRIVGIGVVVALVHYVIVSLTKKP